MSIIYHGDQPSCPTPDNIRTPAANNALSRPSKKSSSLYLNVRMPHRLQRPSICAEMDDAPGHASFQVGTSGYDPGNRVQSLINQVRDSSHQARHLFVEMDVLTQRGDDFEWREWARWVKYEEKVEDGGKRWSKPHVASLNMHYLLELRKEILEGVLLLDVECHSISQVVEYFLEAWVAKKSLEPVLRQHIRTLCLKQHRYRHEKGRPEDRKKNSKPFPVSGDGGKFLSPTYLGGELKTVHSAISLNSSIERENSELSLEGMGDELNRKANVRFLRKIPKGSEVANVMIAEVEELSTTLCGFMRLSEARIIGDMAEVSLPTRFIFCLLGPKGSLRGKQESGRCLSTMFVDDVFREVAYKAHDCKDIIAGIDEFLEQVTVLPPGEWDPKIRIEPPDKVPDQKFRTVSSRDQLFLDDQQHVEEEGNHCDPDLVFSGRPFGGLVKDIRGKLPFYISDFKDALHVQCLASFVYIFLATLTPNVTFGGLLGQETDQYMGVMECILAAAVTGVGFALFAGQPLNILGSTGPMLLLEKIIFQFCKDNDWDFLQFRFWIGIWIAGIMLAAVVFDLSVLVRYITRFTEESFASLIAIIFMYEALVKLFEIAEKDAPLQLHPHSLPEMPYCYCTYSTPVNWNFTQGSPLLDNMSFDAMNQTECLAISSMINVTRNGTPAWVCDPSSYVPDVFLFSCILFATTFFMAIFLVDFRNWPCFPSFVRQMLGDFSVLIAILSMIALDAILGLPTPKLIVPAEFKPTKSDARGWVVNPLDGSNPWWLAVAGCLPALLATILIFLDQQITSVILNRKENKLVKGKGYHLDLLVLAILIAVHSLLGLPWYVAATVTAIAHVNSLKKQSECTAPGERPTFLGVREQRVTALLVGIFSGAAVFITNILKFIPMPVLYGVFFFMGWSALKSMQFTDRVLLLFMPVKYQPDHIYLRHVPLWRVHIFTLVQIVCLATLWTIKSIKTTSIIFPLLVLLIGVVRKILECMYTQHELKYLDDLFPSTKKHDLSKAVNEYDEKISDSLSNKDSNKLSNGSSQSVTPPNGTFIAGPYTDEYKVSFFLSGDHHESPLTYDNKGFELYNTKL